jgi:hypothetical protein
MVLRCSMGSVNSFILLFCGLGGFGFVQMLWISTILIAMIHKSGFTTQFFSLITCSAGMLLFFGFLAVTNFINLKRIIALF